MALSEIRRITHERLERRNHHPTLLPLRRSTGFSVNAGVPIEDALEIATNLILYVERMAAADAFENRALESAIIQHLSEMAKALNLACKHSVKKTSETNA